MIPKALPKSLDDGLASMPIVAEEPHTVVASSGISPRLWHLYAQFWLVCLLFPILFLVQTPFALAHRVTGVGALALYVGAYTWFMWPHPAHRRFGTRPSRRLLPMLFAGLLLLVLLFSLIFGAAFLWLFVGASAVAGVVLSPRQAFVVVTALTLLTLGLGVGLSGGLGQTDWLHLLPLALLVRGLGLDMAGLTRLSEALAELHRARGELARQAVTEERLRLARDLHDLLGHTLSLITLKSELAGRLVDRAPSQAAQEIREVEQEARRALREVREAVSGYRQPTLDSELESARQILEAAGIRCDISHTTAGLSPAVDAVLAWTVREGVTNVIRHSRASYCLIRVTGGQAEATVEVVNDRNRAADMARASTSGSGLSGLAERVAALDGRLDADVTELGGGFGFRLWVSVPMDRSRERSV